MAHLRKNTRDMTTPFRPRGLKVAVAALVAALALIGLESGAAFADDPPALLTLVKTVTNDNGGTATPSAWALSADGPTPISGVSGSPAVTNATVDAGTYTLAESDGPAGYTASAWLCMGGTLTGSSVEIASGAVVTCTINNDDQPTTPATLTLVKTVTNDNGGTAVPTDWALSADGPTPISGAPGDPSVTNATVVAGTYTLGESGGPAGYTASVWSCTGGNLTGSSLTIPSGADVTCTINNDDDQARLTLVMNVINDGGGTAVPGDWTLSADGPTTGITGVSGAAQVTSVPVDIGSYALSATGVPAAYVVGAWSCDNGGIIGSIVTIALGQNVTCTSVSNDIVVTPSPPELSGLANTGADPARLFGICAMLMVMGVATLWVSRRRRRTLQDR